MSRQLNNFVNKKIKGLKDSIKSVISRFVLESTDASKKMQEVKGEIYAEEVKEELEHFEPYGFTSRPPKGSEGLALSVNGNRDHTVIINIGSRQFRLKTLEIGEVAIYSQFDSYLIFKSDGSIEVKCTDFNVSASSKAKFTTPMVEATKEMTVKENITVIDENTDIAEIKQKYNNHRHNENADTITDPPDLLL